MANHHRLAGGVILGRHQTQTGLVNRSDRSILDEVIRLLVRHKVTGQIDYRTYQTHGPLAAHRRSKPLSAMGAAMVLRVFEGGGRLYLGLSQGLGSVPMYKGDWAYIPAGREVQLASNYEQLEFASAMLKP